MLTCFFDCPVCGLKDVKVEVPAREGEHVDAVNWMHSVVFPAIGDEHHRRSPNCSPEKLANLRIPCDPDAEFLGQQRE